jgi:hypothetical protein
MIIWQYNDRHSPSIAANLPDLGPGRRRSVLVGNEQRRPWIAVTRKKFLSDIPKFLSNFVALLDEDLTIATNFIRAG